MRRNGLRCGPLAITLRAETPVLGDKALETLNLYNVRWEDGDREALDNLECLII